MVEDVHRARHKLAILNDDEQSDRDNVIDDEDEDSEAEDQLFDLHQFRSEIGFKINKRALPPVTLGRGHYRVVGGSGDRVIMIINELNLMLTLDSDTPLHSLQPDHINQSIHH